MENERDVAFRPATGAGGIDQGKDFPGSSTAGIPSGDGPRPGMDIPDQGLKAKAREAASTAGHRAAEKVQERISDQKFRATDSLESVARSLRTAGEQLPDENGMSRYMLQAASQVDNLATFLDDRDITELIDDVEDFARRQPTAFVGGAFAFGMVAARFLKSSRRNLESQDRDWEANAARNGFGDPGPDRVPPTQATDLPSSAGRAHPIEGTPDFL